MKTAKKLMKKKRIYKTQMDGILLREQSELLWCQAEEKLEEIMNRYPSLPKGVRMHTDRIFPAAAVYLTLKEPVGQEKAYGVIEDSAVAGCRRIEKKLVNLLKLPGMKALFVRFWDPMVKKVFGSKNGFGNVFYPKKKGEYRMDITACPYCRYFTEAGCPELTRIFCENDERIYGNLPGLKFERTGTLGKGAACCDFFLAKI